MLDGMSGGRPGDRRGFVHKKILGGIATIAGILPIPGGAVISRVAGALAGRAPCPPGFSQTSKGCLPIRTSAGERARMGTSRPLSLGTIPIPGFLPCIFPAHRDPVSGLCILGERRGRDLPGGFEVGEAVMGQYGAGLVPGSQPIDRAVCLKGMQLGNDGICYNKSQISNKQRMWPAGRKPLLTGGDMRAISIAARAGRRLEGTTKRLQKLGMMRKAASRRALAPAPTQHQRLLEAHITK